MSEDGIPQLEGRIRVRESKQTRALFAVSSASSSASSRCTWGSQAHSEVETRVGAALAMRILDPARARQCVRIAIGTSADPVAHEALLATIEPDAEDAVALLEKPR